MVDSSSRFARFLVQRTESKRYEADRPTDRATS